MASTTPIPVPQVIPQTLTQPPETMYQQFAKILAAGAALHPVPPVPAPVHVPVVAETTGRTWLQLVLIGVTVVLVLFVAGVCMKRSYERLSEIGYCGGIAPHVGRARNSFDNDLDHVMGRRAPHRASRRVADSDTESESYMSEDDGVGSPDTDEGNNNNSHIDATANDDGDDDGDDMDPNFTPI